MAVLQAREQSLAGSKKDKAKPDGANNGGKSETYLRNEIAELRAFKLEVVNYFCLTLTIKSCRTLLICLSISSTEIY